MSLHIAQGFSLKVNAVSVGKVASLGGINVQVDEEEVTSVTSTDNYREFMPTLRDAGGLDVEVYMDDEDDGQEEMRSLLDSGEIVPCELIFPAAMHLKWTFSAYVSSFTSGEAAPGDILKCSATLRISGKPTLVDTTPTGDGG